jgi:signal transduction histidine kinase
MSPKFSLGQCFAVWAHHPQQPAFSVTRRKLALWYTGATTVILLTSGLIIYALVAHARWLSLEREMQLLAIQVEDQLELSLTTAGQLDPRAKQQFPELCFYADPCSISPVQTQTPLPKPVSALLRPQQQADICIRLVDPANRPVAWFQLPSSPVACQNPQWQGTRVGGHYYHRISYPLHTPAQATWGNVQIIQSLNDFDLYMLRVEVALASVIVAAIGAAGFASWHLAGLAMQPVQQSYQQMEQFTADAAHELRSPLASLRAIVQTAIRSEQLSAAEIQETLQILNRQSQRLSKLVQDLLLFSQIEQASTGETKRPCDLNQILAEVIDEFKAVAIASELTLTAEIQPLSLPVLGNPDQLHRAIANLVSNAVNYTPSGGRVSVITTRTATHALAHVHDTGMGIAPSEQHRIFDRFYRVNSDRSCRQGGAGLGLAITQAIVQAHSGTLTVQSEPGQGSRFTLSLPIATGNGRVTN